MPLDPKLTERIAECLERHSGCKADVARELGIARSTVIAHCGAIEPEAPKVNEREFEVSGNSAKLTYSSEKRIVTEEDAIRHGQFDMRIWKADRIKIKAYEVTINARVIGADGKRRSDEPTLKPMWAISLELSRRMPEAFQVADDALFDRIKAIVPAFPKVIHRKPSSPHMLVAALNDVHFGKLAWARETGEDYDLRIAERLFRDALEDILARSHGYDIEKIVLPVGNDFFHVDGITNQTTAGTPQDVDGRYHKMIEVGEMALVWAVDLCRHVAPVEVLHVPGNHDRIASWHACRTLAATFHRCDDVKVDTEPKTRKYNLYGPTLLGFTHGCDERPSSLPSIMANEVPDLWAASQYREWIGGHWHQSKQTQFNPVATHDGVRYRSTLSMSGRDSWHYRKGYVGGKRAAEAFLYCGKTGDVHSFEVSMRQAG